METVTKQLQPTFLYALSEPEDGRITMLKSDYLRIYRPSIIVPEAITSYGEIGGIGDIIRDLRRQIPKECNKIVPLDNPGITYHAADGRHITDMSEREKIENIHVSIPILFLKDGKPLLSGNPDLSLTSQ